MYDAETGETVATGSGRPGKRGEGLGGDPHRRLLLAARVRDGAVRSGPLFEIGDWTWATVMHPSRREAGGKQPLNRPGCRLGVGRFAGHLGHPAVAVLRSLKVMRGAADRAAGTAAGCERLRNGSGVVDIAGCGTTAVVAEGAARGLLGDEPANGSGDRPAVLGEARGAHCQDAERREVHEPFDRSVAALP